MDVPYRQVPLGPIPAPINASVVDEDNALPVPPLGLKSGRQARRIMPGEAFRAKLDLSTFVKCGKCGLPADSQEWIVHLDRIEKNEDDEPCHPVTPLCKKCLEKRRVEKFGESV